MLDSAATAAVRDAHGAALRAGADQEREETHREHDASNFGSCTLREASADEVDHETSDENQHREKGSDGHAQKGISEVFQRPKSAKFSVFLFATPEKLDGKHTAAALANLEPRVALTRGVDDSTDGAEPALIDDAVRVHDFVFSRAQDGRRAVCRLLFRAHTSTTPEEALSDRILSSVRKKHARASYEYE
jgi:hypothetical protein